MFDKAFNDLVSYLKAWEEFRDKPYYATEDERKRGILTIGYGFTYPESILPKSITKREAHNKLVSKIESISLLLFNMPIEALLHYTKNSAIVSLAYNMGLNGFPKLLNCLKNGDDIGALDQFYDGIYQAKKPVLGLIYRRACDAQIFEKGIYQRRDYITPLEKERFLRMNAKNKDAIDMINNRVKVQG